MTSKLRDKIVVITGASSGIGRAAALAFAREGAAVVVAARRDAVLDEVARECEQVGARALAVPVDVTREEEVKALARRAVETFGRIDVWVNNAAVTMLGPFEEAPAEDFRRVIETNLFGYIHGARAVIPYFREQGRGTLINNASMVAKAGEPYASAYVTSKFGIRGLNECLRLELRDAGIDVCLVLPASIDTPLFQHAANYMGRAVKPLKPIYRAEEVAEAIVKVAKHPKRETYVGPAGRLLVAERVLAPALFDRMVPRQMERNHFQDKPAPPSSGNLFQPMPEGTGVSGGWRNGRGSRKGRAVLAGAALAGAGLLAWRALRGRALA